MQRQRCNQFSFSGSGWALTYYLGFAKALRELSIPACQFAGASGGSIVAVILACDVENFDDIFKWVQSLSCTEQLAGNVHKLFLTGLANFLPDDAFLKASGNAFISVTQVLPSPRNIIICNFQTNDALIRALLASSHIPGYTSRDVFFKLTPSSWCVDGGLTKSTPILSERTFTVSPFPPMSASQRKYDVCPWNWFPVPFSVQDVLRCAFFPDPVILEQLYNLGYEQGLMFFRSSKFQW
jgi:hypothetical protein